MRRDVDLRRAAVCPRARAGTRTMPPHSRVSAIAWSEREKREPSNSASTTARQYDRRGARTCSTSTGFSGKTSGR